MAKKLFLASNFYKFVSNRFAMLHVFYKQLRLEDSTESCVLLRVNFDLLHISCLGQSLMWKKSSVSVLVVSLYN